jgi:hypothetical protein
MPASFSMVMLTKKNASQLHNRDYAAGVTDYLVDGKLMGLFVFCVGLAVTHQVYCSLSRLIVLTPL